MAVRSLNQILNEIGTVYNPQIEGVKRRQADLPGQIKAEEQGLQAKQTEAFGNILDGARRRGLGFSGIPLGEQARYTSTEFLPALARLKQSGRERAMSLEDAIAQIRERKQGQALGIRQYEQQRFDANQQFERQLQAQREAEERAAARARASAAATAPADSWMSALMGGGRQTTPTSRNRPSLNDIFGRNSQPALRVAQPTSQTRLQPASRVSVQPANYNPQGARVNLQGGNIRLQGGGNTAGVLRVRR